ncbi:hypothetical protein GCM10010329_02920 [Streptomyces spiroverticillatus]|uniref:DUF3558 domain-containing protein n=1 Tax=Streptomyces finlayi TaxID=67296 RepID=A0A919C700_9ACTN|nr:hypothetical protein [Streptomyces finlayi]GGZ86493.1 hypothetical protein GCM10010329_02920 [Streptomyces spiroverticillatus]GHC78020.1 hypothetical protein GCM10010334_02900 [Streptomyces finlayi]
MKSRRIWVGAASAVLLLTVSACGGGDSGDGATESGKGGGASQAGLTDPASPVKDAKTLDGALLRAADLPKGWKEDAQGDNGGIKAQAASCDGPCDGLAYEGVGNYTDASGSLVGTSVKAYGSKGAAEAGYKEETKLASDATAEKGPAVGNTTTYVKSGEDADSALRVVHFRVGTVVVAVSQEYRSKDTTGLSKFASDQAARLEQALKGS